jgi:DNA-binding LytR/AlgR family response regulator
MKLHIDIDPNIKESSITIQTHEIDTRLKNIIEFIEQTTKPKQINGRKGKDIHLIELDQVHRFYILDKVLTMETEKGEYLVDQRLYQIEQNLTESFIKISKSEIVNFDYVDHLSFTNKGLVQIFMKNGTFTYSSRRYLKDIKERLKL